MINLNSISTISLWLGAACALIILIDLLAGYRQHMMIMNFVYPITGLYAGPLALIFYFTIGRKGSHRYMMKRQMGQRRNGNRKAEMDSMEKMAMPKKPFWQSVAVGALHCGSGCTLGDILSEGIMALFPLVLFGSTIYGGWAVAFVCAFVIGIAFQYYSIKPMKNLSPGQALRAALKADFLSLTFWQIGMYGWMAIAIFVLFGRLHSDEPLFWFMMQIAMLCGFATAFPINWWLIRKGVKEAM